MTDRAKLEAAAIRYVQAGDELAANEAARELRAASEAYFSQVPDAQLEQARIARDCAQRVLHDALDEMRTAQDVYDARSDDYCVALEAAGQCPHCHHEPESQ